MAKVAFLGLGVMGYPMAGHLKAKGHEVTVYNRTAAKAEKWVAEHGGTARARRPREAAEGAEIVFACVGNDDDLRAVALGPRRRLRRAWRRARSSSTTPPPRPTSRASLHAAAKEQGVGFVDAPVSGGQAGAENGALTVMCGGDAGRLTPRPSR